MAAGRFRKPARRQHLQPVKAMRALLCAAAAVAAYSCAASLSFASGPSGRCAHQAARRTAASPRGSRLPRASRGGEAPGDPRLPFEKLEVGQKYKGTVGKVRDFGAFVDIGATSDGLVHISCIADEHVDTIHDYVQEGQEVEVWVSELGDDGKLSLSMVESRIGQSPRARRQWLEDLSPDEWLEGTVTRVQPYGAFVKVSHHGDMAEGLVPNGELSDSSAYVENVEDEVQEGQKVKVRLLKYDAKEKKVAFSMKQPNMFEVGQKFTGTVRSVRDFGALVDIGTTVGLVHISCIADERVDNIHDYVQEGQEVGVWISQVLDDGKLDLTMLESRIGQRPRARRALWLEDLSPGEWLEGTVSGVQPFGAFVKVSHYGDMAEGLVYKSQLSDAYVENVEDEVQEGQRVKVRLLKYDAKEKKVYFSMKRPADLSKFEGTSPDQWLTGKVTGTAPYGAFVAVAGEDGSEAAGLVHVTQLTDDLVESFEDALQLGQEVKVRIVDLDAGAGKMALSMKPAGSHEE